VLSPREQVIEDFGLYFERYALPRIVGRIYGALMIADSPAVGLDQLVADLNISKASASTAVRQLHSFLLIEKVSLPGDRRDYYRVAPDAHVKYVQRTMTESLRFAQLIERATQLEDLTPAARLKLERLEHLYEALSANIQSFFETYDFDKDAPAPTPTRQKRGQR
jgi:DNA-binding transcriptional regulator GbsR (MarR family)